MKQKVAKVATPKREKGERYQTMKAKILILLQERNDLTRQSLAEVLGKPVEAIDQGLCQLRKAGIRVFPSKGPGSPLRIATSERESLKYINHRRRLFLPTVTRMIVQEQEIADQFVKLSDQPKTLLLELNNATAHESKIRNSAD